MLIVIEGVDRTGKTFLARRIANKVGGVVIHAGPPRLSSIEEYETAIDDYNPLGSKHLILDRWNWGEYVWPKIFGRGTDFDTATRIHIEMFLKSRGAVYVLASRMNKKKLMQELVEFNEPLSPDDLFRAELHFNTVAGLAGTQPHVWDFEIGGDFQVDEIIRDAEYTQEWVQRYWSTVGPGFVTGSYTPTVLLVGDELGPEKKTRNPPYAVPFAPYPATSGHYLLDSLKNWRNAAIINSRFARTGQTHQLSAVWESFFCPKVIALGKRAGKALSEFEIPYTEIPHPQYWRRFHYHKQDFYTTFLEEAVA